MATIVTGFIDLNEYDPTKRPSTKSREFYQKNAERLLKLPHNKIVFLEQKSIDTYKQFVCSNTTIIPFEKEDLFFWKYREEILQCTLPAHRQPDKDTHDYMMVQLQKTDWVKRAIELNPYGSSQFIWMDMGLFWVVKDESVFETAVRHAVSKVYNKVRIAGAWNLNFPVIIYDRVAWYFLGGIFGGSSQELLQFDESVKASVMKIMRQGHWVWEVNAWVCAFLEHRDLFSTYIADHNATMIQEY